MQQSLHGCSLLIVEDEPLLLMDIESEFSDCGAELTVTTMIHHAMNLVERGGISAAILDHVIGQDNSAPLYDRLFERGIPFVIYTAMDLPEKDRKCGVLISKPALPGVLRTAIEGLLSPQAVSR
jgi:DNA-binding response OmpR family regulator